MNVHLLCVFLWYDNFVNFEHVSVITFVTQVKKNVVANGTVPVFCVQLVKCKAFFYNT